VLCVRQSGERVTDSGSASAIYSPVAWLPGSRVFDRDRCRVQRVRGWSSFVRGLDDGLRVQAGTWPVRFKCTSRYATVRV
jgi:hypothetical protein